MKVVIISILTLLFISLSDILSCNERKRIFEKAALYRNEIMLWILTACRVVQIPLVIYLGILNWKALIAVIIIAVLGMRIFIDGFVERFVVIPIYFVLIFFAERSRRK